MLDAGDAGQGGAGGSGGGGSAGVGGAGGSGAGGSGGGGTGGGGPGGAAVVVDAGQPLVPGDPGPADVRFEVRSDRDVHPISALIYGTNTAPEHGTAAAQSPAQNRFGALRMGGNRLTAYNWENNASNAGSDWNHQNDDYLWSVASPGEAVKVVVDAAKTIGAAVLLTVPILDHVAADTLGDGDVNKTPNYLTARFKQNRALKGSPLTLLPATTDAFVAQDEFVNWVKSTQAGARILFSLDNEPDLWSSTHPRIHPNDLTYDELCTRNITFATMIKNVWPSAPVTGFVSYGWNGYTNLQGAPDNAAKGDFTDYWLKKMQAAHTAAGKRLVDYLDLHWYPEAEGSGTRITGPETSAAVVAARVQAPRSLFESTYKEKSWIVDSSGEAIRLIPRMKEKIASNYPGTQLAFTEWNYGGGGHISGAVASADVLGIFGREGVGLANFWELNPSEAFSYAAFRVFRNFDGAGAAFGDTSIIATSTLPATATVYASLDASDPTRVVIVAINKTTSSKTVGLTVAHPTNFTKLAAYVLAGASPTIVSASPVTATSTNAFRATLPALSVTVLVPKP